MVPVPVPTFERLWFRFLLLKIYSSGSGSAPKVDHKKQIFQKIFGKNIAFLLSKLFYKEKVYKFQQIYCKV
jgi:hypothetical protein